MLLCYCSLVIYCFNVKCEQYKNCKINTEIILQLFLWKDDIAQYTSGLILKPFKIETMIFNRNRLERLLFNTYDPWFQY